MRADSLVTGLAGVLFGLLVGWMLGAQQAPRPAGAVDATAAAPASSTQQQGRTAPALDTNRVQELEARAQANPSDGAVRAELGNLYFDAEQFVEAAKWYEASLQVAPKNADVSTDLAVSYYYTNQTDKALAQFARSIEIDPTHGKSWLNLGIVRAFGKQDLAGAEEAWKKVLEHAPADAPEARAARQALEGLKAAHP